MKKKYKLISALSIFIVVIIVAISALPILISSPKGKQFALDQINQRISGKLAVASWSLKWLGSMSIDQLTFDDINGQRLLELSKISISRGLLKLITDHNDLGNISLTKPLVSIPTAQATPVNSHTPNSSPNVQKAKTKTNQEASKNQNKKNSETKNDSASEKSFTIPSITGTIVIDNGEVQLYSSDSTAQTVIKNLNVKFDLAGLGKPISFKVNGSPMTPESILALSGKLTLPEDEIDIDKIHLDMMLNLKNIDINTATTLAALYSDAPKINGNLNADIKIKGDLTDGFGIQSDVSVSNLAMPEKNAQFGDIKIALDGNATKTSANINSATINSKFCNITAAGKYGGTGSGEIRAKSDIDLATTVNFLKGMGIITNDISCAGKLMVAINGTSADDIITAKQADIKISNLDLNYQGKKLKLDSMLFSTPAEINITTRQIKIPVAKLTIPQGSVILNSLDIADWADALNTIKTDVQADLDIKSTRSLLYNFIALPDNWGVSGRLKTNLKIDFTKPENYNLKLNATTSALKIESIEPSLIIEDSPTLSVDLTTNQKFDTININSAKLNSEILDLDLAANFKKTNDQNSFSMNGTWAPSMTELSRYISTYASIPVTVSGKRSEPFDIKTSWKGNKDTFKMQSIDGKAGLYADTLDGFGFHVRTLTIPIVFKDKDAELKINAKVNDGDLNFVSNIDLSETTPTISMPDDLVILNNINITTEVADELLGLINPVFKGISTVNGKMSFVMNNFSWPLNEKDLMARLFSGKIIFNDVNLAANGLLTDILDLVKEDTRELNIGSANIDIKCADGKIKSSPLPLRIKKYELIFDGTVGLDSSLDYYAKVPMTETLVGKDVYKYLAGTSLDIPIKGTIQKPILNLKSFNTAISKLIGDAATKALSNELENQFKKLFQ